MQFKVGDKAVYPSHGVTVIKNIESREIAGNSQEFYVLQILSSGATLMVPIASSERVGMRDLIDKRDIEGVYSIIRTPGKVSQKTWNRRFREFNDKLRSGSLGEIAEVLRDLWSLQASKELSYGEKKMMEKAKSLIVAEVSAAQGNKAEDIETQVDQMLMPN